MRRAAFIAGSAAAAVLPLQARAQIVPGAQTSTIGVNVPLTGTFAQYGQEVVRGAQAAVNETNRLSILPLQRYYTVRAFDDQNANAIASTNVAIAQADITIIGMVGHLTSSVTIATLPQYANVNFPLIVPTVTAEALTRQGYRNVFRLPTKDSSEGSLFARGVLQGRKHLIARAVIVDGSYGLDVARGFISQAKADHHDADIVTLPAGTVDPAVASKMILDTSPAFVFLCGRPSDLGPVAEAMRLAGYHGEFGASDAFYTQATIDGFAKPLDGAMVAASLPPLQRVPAMQQQFADFQREVTNISAFSAYGYAAAQLLISVAQRINATTRLQVLSALQRPSNYTLLVGEYSFDFAGDATLPNVYLYKITKSGFTFTKPAYPTGFVV